METCIIGIDPGQKGGVALLTDQGAQVWPMPPTVAQLVALVTGIAGASIMVVERAQPMPRQGVTSVFSYGQHFGGFEVLAACLSLRYVTIPPATWKKAMGLTSVKTDSIREAERLFPSVPLVLPRCRKPHDGMAEALLIAEYARRKNL
jgi:crossover junction endodeoxyribonuclease RuvC